MNRKTSIPVRITASTWNSTTTMICTHILRYGARAACAVRSMRCNPPCYVLPATPRATQMSLPALYAVCAAPSRTTLRPVAQHGRVASLTLSLHTGRRATRTNRGRS